MCGNSIRRRSHRPRPHVRHRDAVLLLLGVGLDPDRLLPPLAGLRPLALLDREADERDAEGVDRFLASLRPLVERLVQHVVVRATQSAADDLLGEKRRAEGPQPEDVGHALHVPALGEHVHADDAAHVLAGPPLRADRVDHLAQHSLVALVGVEHLRVDRDRHPARAVLVIGIA